MAALSQEAKAALLLQHEAALAEALKLKPCAPVLTLTPRQERRVWRLLGVIQDERWEHERQENERLKRKARARAGASRSRHGR